jgi:hypothetical protein
LLHDCRAAAKQAAVGKPFFAIPDTELIRREREDGTAAPRSALRSTPIVTTLQPRLKGMTLARLVTSLCLIADPWQKHKNVINATM